MRPDRLGHGKAVIVFGIGGKLGGRCRFQPQIKLAFDHGMKMRDHIHGPQAAGLGQQPFDDLRREIEGVNVRAEGPFDTGAQHLDGHFRPRACQPRAVHLRDGGRGDRLGHFGKDGRDRAAQFLGHHLQRDGLRERGQLVLQVAQFACQFMAHHIGPRGKRLAELDIGRAKGGQRAGERGQRFIPPQPQPFERPTQNAGRHAQARGRVQRFQHHLHRARALECRARADQPPDVMGSAHGSEFPTRMERRDAHRGNLRIDSTRY